jgi:hypothetical protein
MGNETCSVCKSICLDELDSSRCTLNPFDLEKSATADRQCVLCSVLFRSLRNFLLDHSLPATENTPTIFPDGSTIDVYHPSGVNDKTGTVILKVRWLVIVDGATDEMPIRGFDLELFTLLGVSSRNFLFCMNAYRIDVL